jgi:hypothetical protein
VRTFCDHTKRSLHDAHTARTGGSLRLPRFQGKKATDSEDPLAQAGMRGGWLLQ